MYENKTVLSEIICNDSLIDNKTTIPNFTSYNDDNHTFQTDTIANHHNNNITSVTNSLSVHNLIFVTVNLFLVPLIIGGNALVLLSIASFPRLRTVSNIFVSSLAVADLLVGLLVIPFYTVYYLSVPGVTENKYACLFKYAFIIESCGSSIFNLSAIAFERYVAVSFPLKYSAIMTRRKAKLIVTVLWTYVTVLSLAPIAGINTWRANAACDFYLVLPMGYTVLGSFVTVSVGMVTTSVFYALIYWEIRKMRRFTENQSRLDKSHNRDVRSAFVMAVVSLTFLMFWLPYIVIGPLKYIPTLDREFIERLKNYTLCLAISNSMVNPFIYGCLRKDFLSAYRTFLCNPCSFRRREKNFNLALSHSCD